ncbi:MAG: helix-turn-helix domain-containing protein [Dorea sp.]|uniref:helix-turn-helix domain-containing protein n=1 Tax=Dorea sp. AM10-31 TaxID=2293098 RepID=UPI0011C14B3A
MQKIRLEHAESMPEHTDKTVDEIMHTVGYNNKRYFYKIFQQKYDTPAAKYRHSH